MYKIWLILSSFLVLFQAACSGQAESTEDRMDIGITTNLADYQSLVYECSLDNAQYVRIDILPLSALMVGDYDAVIQVGQPIQDRAFLTQIGIVRPIFVVNPANPITQLSPGELSDIFLGTVADWHLISPQDYPASVPIHVWSYPPGDDVRFGIETILLEGRPLTSQSYLAPDQQSMLEAILVDSAAIGFILERHPHAAVKTVTVNSVAPFNLQQPTIVSFAITPEVQLIELTNCLAQKEE
jgi:hypothetical protein